MICSRCGYKIQHYTLTQQIEDADGLGVGGVQIPNRTLPQVENIYACRCMGRCPACGRFTHYWSVWDIPICKNNNARHLQVLWQARQDIGTCLLVSCVFCGSQLDCQHRTRDENGQPIDGSGFAP